MCGKTIGCRAFVIDLGRDGVPPLAAKHKGFWLEKHCLLFIDSFRHHFFERLSIRWRRDAEIRKCMGDHVGIRRTFRPPKINFFLTYIRLGGDGEME